MDLEYVLKVLENNSDRFADVVFDAKSILDQNKDPGLDGNILGIQAVAEQGVTSLDALIAKIRADSAPAGEK